MSDYLGRVAEARVRVSPRWTSVRERALRGRVERAIGRRRAALRALGGAVLVVTALFLGHAGYRQWFGSEHLVAQPAVRHEVPKLLELTDGTLVTAVSGDARLKPVEVQQNKVSLRLEAGSAHFSVTHREDRRFEVHAGSVTVSVLGTEFTVGLDANGVRVAVERGRVDVAWGGAHHELVTGERVLAPLESAADTTAKTNDVAASERGETPEANQVNAQDNEPERADVETNTDATNTDGSAAAANGTLTQPRVTVAAQPSWRALAQEGDYRGAFARIQAEGNGSVHDNPGDLLFAADVARLSGHAALALPWLERVLKAHSSDSRTPLAAFTLGRILLDSLGRPREAADAFARARRLSPAGELAQDALAREVESWSRAGEVGLAHERALEYLKSYPNGRREKAVRKHGGIE